MSTLRPYRRARWLLAGLLAAAAVLLSGCDLSADRETEPFIIASGSAGGVYAEFGAQFAEVLSRELDTRVTSEPTQGSVDNLQRVASGRALLGFAQGDTAADAIVGRGAFAAPLNITALARVYDEYVHLVVSDDSQITEVADLSGRTVSLGARSSGVQSIAQRVLAAADVPAQQIDNPELGLVDSIAALEGGTIDGFFWVGGVPTPAITELAERDEIRLIPIEAEVVQRVNSEVLGVYRLADFPSGTYGMDEQVSTMTVPNYLIAAEGAPEELISDVVRELFESRSDIAQQVRAAEFLDRRQAIFTEPVRLHPGAVDYYVSARR